MGSCGRLISRKRKLMRGRKRVIIGREPWVHVVGLSQGKGRLMRGNLELLWLHLKEKVG